MSIFKAYTPAFKNASGNILKNSIAEMQMVTSVSWAGMQLIEKGKTYIREKGVDTIRFHTQDKIIIYSYWRDEYE